MRNKMSPKNRMYKGQPLKYMVWNIDGTNEYGVPVRVKNKKGGGYKTVVVKVVTTDKEECSKYGLDDLHNDLNDFLNSFEG